MKATTYVLSTTGAGCSGHHPRHATVQDPTVRLLPQPNHVPPAAQAQAAHVLRPLPPRDLVPADLLLLHPHASPGAPGTRSVTIRFKMFATLLSHCSYTVVTLLLHCCYTVVTLLLHCCYTVVTLLLHCCFTLALARPKHGLVMLL
jgi:hypothetical protein